MSSLHIARPTLLATMSRWAQDQWKVRALALDTDNASSGIRSRRLRGSANSKLKELCAATTSPTLLHLYHHEKLRYMVRTLFFLSAPYHDLSLKMNQEASG
jgi:hypothetical protein